MQTIGLIGGMSWESSLAYYRLANELVKEERGDPHSAKIVMYSVDFAEFKRLQHRGEWQLLTTKMIDIADKLETAGADMLLICANTMHLMAPQIQEKTTIPLLHIADATAAAIKAEGLEVAGLLGTRFTMEKDFYRTRLADKHGIEVVVPDLPERKTVHEIIYKELISGIVRQESRDKLTDIIKDLKANKQAEGIILGCTELPMLTTDIDFSLPLFNTMELHVRKAVNRAL